MKKRIISISLIVLCILTSCSKTPNNIQGNNHNVDLDSENNKVSVKHILDDFDEAFETKYTKFSLPEKSKVIINQPEEVCDLELKYVNADKSMDWLKERVYKLADIFNVTNGNMNTNTFWCNIETNKEEVSMGIFSEPYYCTKEFIDWDNMDITKLDYINRTNLNELDKEYKNVIDKSIKLSNEVNSIMGGSLTNNPTEFYIKNYKNEKYYDVYLQPSYKGVGIQNVSPTYGNSGIFEGDNALMTMSMNIMYDSNLNLIAYISCNNYIPVKDEAIEKIISLKGACDILESQLAENMTLEFDDVKLWYEPRGTILDATSEDGFDGSKTTRCTPKWFFISDNDDDSNLHHAINYVTVDCVTGEIEVFFPG